AVRSHRNADTALSNDVSCRNHVPAIPPPADTDTGDGCSLNGIAGHRSIGLDRNTDATRIDLDIAAENIADDIPTDSSKTSAVIEVRYRNTNRGAIHDVG